MKTLTYGDLRTLLLNNVYKTKYYKLTEYLRKTIGDGNAKFNLFGYLNENRDKIILTAKNEKDLKKKTNAFIKNKFKLMGFGITDEIKSRIEDRKKSF